MYKSRPKALKPGIPSPRILSRAEPWSRLGRAQGSAQHLVISEARAEPKSPGFAAVIQSLHSGIVVQYLYKLPSPLLPDLSEAPAAQQ
jgi:hypothetical protein